MSAQPHESPRVIQAVFQAGKFVPRGPVHLTEGQLVEVHLVAEDERTPSERWQAMLAVRGIAKAPSTFNWDYDRDDLYRDIS